MAIMNFDELGDDLGKISEILTESDNFWRSFITITSQNFADRHIFFYRNEMRKLTFSLGMHSF